MLLIIHLGAHSNLVISIRDTDSISIMDQVRKYTNSQDYDYVSDSVFFNNDRVELNKEYRVDFFENDQKVSSYGFVVTNNNITVDDYSIEN